MEANKRKDVRWIRKGEKERKKRKEGKQTGEKEKKSNREREREELKGRFSPHSDGRNLMVREEKLIHTSKGREFSYMDYF